MPINTPCYVYRKVSLGLNKIPQKQSSDKTQQKLFNITIWIIWGTFKYDNVVMSDNRYLVLNDNYNTQQHFLTHTLHMTK